MEIKIDTQKDSKEEIKKAIDFLQRIINDQSSSETSEGSDMFNLFDDSDNSGKNDYYDNESEKKFDDEPKKSSSDIPRVEIFD